MTLYARYEPNKNYPGKPWVVLYYDRCCSEMAAIWDSSYSNQPKPHHRYVNHNCARYDLVWLSGDLPESPIPHPSDQIFAASV